MSQFCPSGVRYFTYKASGNKGKNHPDSINAGQSQVQFISGSQPAIRLAKGSAGATPAGVHKHSGKEMHTTVRHLNAKLSGPAKKAGQDATPEGVRKFGGGKAKRG